MLALVFCISAGAQSEFHIFTDLQDRVISAKIINVDDLRGKVELELENKRRVKVKPSIFIDTDQAYIHDWKSLKSFSSSSAFKVELKKRVIESWTEKGTAQRDFERIVYEIVLTNRGTIPLNNLVVAYNVFYEQELLKSTGQYTEKICKKGYIQHAQLSERESYTLKTEPIVVFDQHLSGGYDGYVGGLPERQEGDIKGIWVRVVMTTPSGASETRDFLSPESLKNHQAWQEPAQGKVAGSKGGKKKKKKKS
jgi:hypothetical protein